MAETAAAASRLAPSPATVASLTAALIKALGAQRVSTVEAARRAASTDFAHLSPILTAALPARPADVVAYPGSPAELVEAVRIASEHGVPIVPRGRGTGNYGQAVPLAAGLVIDLTGLESVLDVGQGWIHAQAGATFVALEAAARRRGQEIAIQPTTVGSTIGGFLAGGAGGIGSIENGWLWDGFVLALDTVTCPPGPAAVTLVGEQCSAFLHAYGVTGIIAAATVKLTPAREWLAVIASFASFADAVQVGQSLLELEPAARLVSLDDPALVGLYPPDEALPADRYSLRAVIEVSAREAVLDLVKTHGGTAESVTPDAIGYLSTLSFNHVTLRAKRSRPELCHLQVSGEALVTQPQRVREALPGAMLHLDGMRLSPDPAAPRRGRGFGGLLLSPFHDTATLYDGIARLQELGVHVVDPHTWLLGGPALPGIRAAAAHNDPRGLLNPGKLP
ncbi:dehydrogenase [Rhizocola hellebori]|uniref:Dehydrogenase n=1 Tax=Rhizocola hellebori TaxID=1392758 RepID=A0A8J3Q9J7_9ACTN|nr:dehydrogenase [Rhizocola hellebori]